MPRTSAALIIQPSERQALVEAICEACDVGFNTCSEDTAYKQGVPCPYPKGSLLELAWQHGMILALHEEPVVVSEDGQDQVLDELHRQA